MNLSKIVGNAADPKTAEFAELHESGQDFGDFYPVGHLLAAFPKAGDAKSALKGLLDAGWDSSNCRHFSDRAVLAGTQRGLDSATLLSSLGAALKMVELHHDLAAKGCHFLLVHTPDGDSTARAMDIIRRGPVSLAQKYHRLAIETLAQNDSLTGRQK